MHEDEDTPVQDELETLKGRADKLGIKYHPSISVDKLRDRISETLEGKEEEPEKEKDPVVGKETENEFRLRKRKEANKLVRVQITCMNPTKSEWEGEVFTTGNSYIGTFSKYVPFNVEWHVPQVILKQIKQRQCQVFISKRSSRGQTERVGKVIKEFNVAELEPLTEQELTELRRRQAMANNTAD